MLYDGLLRFAEQAQSVLDRRDLAMADLRKAWVQMATTPRLQLQRLGPTVGVNPTG